MKEINERIKLVVSQSALSQTEFSKRLNVTQSYVSALCLGKKTPSDRTIWDICRVFKVDEHWLRTGEGEMSVQRSREEEIAAFAGELLASEPDDIRRRFVFALSQLRTEELEMLQKIALHLVDGLGTSMQKEKLKSSQQDRTEAADEIAPITSRKVAREMSDAELHRELDRQLAEERKVEENPSAYWLGSSGTATG